MTGTIARGRRSVSVLTLSSHLLVVLSFPRDLDAATGVRDESGKHCKTTGLEGDRCTRWALPALHLTLMLVWVLDSRCPVKVAFHERSEVRPAFQSANPL
jgi:hypothetical protein